MLSFVRYYRFVEILSCPTYREESSRLRALRHQGFHNRYTLMVQSKISQQMMVQ